MTFHDREFLFLIPFIFAVWAWKWKFRSEQQASIQVSSIQLFQGIPSSLRMRVQWVPFFFKFIGSVLIVIALARPQSADTKVKKNVEGVDIVIALDISDSMLIEDMSPTNRLESAKETLKNFVQARSSDRIGVIIFAGESFTLVPLTMDYELLLSRVATVQTAQKSRIKDGTAIGVALANAAGRLRDSKAKTRIVIFMTDGENNSGTISPETGLELTKAYGLKIYSIGIGKDGPTKLPITQKDLFGNEVKTYQPFESYVNEDLLSRMASETHGKYYRASQGNSLKGVFQEIDSLEKTKVEVEQYIQYTEQFESFVLWALFFLLMGYLMDKFMFYRSPS